jgi:uncharacterized protein (DUF111 family)
MPRVAYLDCFSGVSGDMLLGAILDGGVPLEQMRRELSSLPLTGYNLGCRRVKRAGLAATQAIVEVDGDQPQRMLTDVLDLIAASAAPGPDKEMGAKIFGRLAEAEARYTARRSRLCTCTTSALSMPSLT